MAEVILQNIKLSYYGKAALDIDRLDFNGALGVLGGAGAGKSNLIKVIAGTEFINSGQILVDDRDIGRDKIRFRNISLISKDTALFKNKTVAYNLAYSIKLRGVNPEIIKKTIREAAEEYSLDLNKKAGILDKKERAALYICRALIKKPALILLDEPSDIIGDIDYFKILFRTKYSGIFVYATYDYSKITDFCDKYILLKRGGIIFCGNKTELINSDNPYIKHFIM